MFDGPPCPDDPGGFAMKKTATIAACAILTLSGLVGCTPKAAGARPAMGLMADTPTMLVAGDTLGMELHGADAPH